MKYFKCKIEFYDRIEPVTGDEIGKLSILPSGYSGTFFGYREQELLTFCEKNPGYHIASFIKGGIIVNYYIPKRFRYLLCYGDSDPELTYLNPEIVELHKRLDLAKLFDDK